MRSTVIAAAILLAVCSLFAQRDTNPYTAPPKIIDRFDGPLGRGRVVVRQWLIPNERVVDIPHTGLLVVHLRAGSATTEISGQRTARAEDSMFSVAPGDRLVFDTDRDSIVVQIVEIIPQ
jgi:hypothetical protein